MCSGHETQARKQRWIDAQVERLSKACSGLDAINQRLTAMMVTDDSGDLDNWPLEHNGSVRGDLYSTLSMITDDIESTF